MLAHWFVARAIKQAALPILFALEVQRVFWTTWHEVYRYE